MIKVIMARGSAIVFPHWISLLPGRVAQIESNRRKRTSKLRDPLNDLSKLCGQYRWSHRDTIMVRILRFIGGALAALAITMTVRNVALADPLALAEPSSSQALIVNQIFRDQAAGAGATEVMHISGVPVAKRRQLVSYSSDEPRGTIVIDTANTYLYYIMGGGTALRYGIGVGREGFTWSGVETITRKAEWPDWFPPPEMLVRQPYLPRVMAGGPGNPLGARAMYLGDTAYRIHGTNQPWTIGGHVSSGCIRMLNDDVIDLYTRVNVGTKVVISPMQGHRALDRPAAIDRSAALLGRHHSSSLY